MTTPATPAMPDQTQTPPPTTPTPGAGDGWQQAAAGANGAAGTNGAAKQPAAPQNPATQTPAPATAPVSTVAAPPAEAKRLPRPGLGGFIDKMVDSLAGTDTSKVRQDAQGNVYIDHPSLTRGQQWLRIGAEALLGAGAGMAQRGAGSKGAALGAGIEAGAKFRQQENNQTNQQLEQMANLTALNHQTAKNAIELTQMNFKLSEDQLKAWQDHEDVAAMPGAKLAGHVDTLQDLTKFMREGTEGYDHADQAQNVTFRPVPIFGKDGKASGFDIYKVPKGMDDEMLPPGTPISVYNEVTGKLEQQNLSGWDTRGHVNQLSAAAHNRFLEVASKESKTNLENRQAEEAAARAKDLNNPQPKPESPDVVAKNRAETAKAWAEAHADQAKADTEAAKSKELSGPLVDEIGQGKMVPGRLSYLLARNPDLLDAVAQKYPGFDSSKIDSYASTYKEFTSGTVGTQLNAGGTVLGHLNELRKLNTDASHIPGTAAWNAYRNKADTVASELAKFYGDATIPAIAAIKGTLTANLPGTRDAAIKTQAESMLDKFTSFRQQWKNAAPSEVYEAKMPWISPEAEAARTELDRAYHGAAAPLTNLHTNPQTGQTIGWNGTAYVDTKTGQVVK